MTAIRISGRRGLVGQTLRDMAAVLGRRPCGEPGETVIGHSSALRTSVFLGVGGELCVEALMDVSMIPPAWRPFHLVWLALMIDLCVAFSAVTRRHPHRLTARTLRIRAGLYDELLLPLSRVVTVRREFVSAKGRGVRPVPGSSGSVLCTVAGTAELTLELDEPVELRLADGSSLTAERLHLSADHPVTAHRELFRAVRALRADGS
ncbi:hypothetical protein AB0M87_06945 [Streptomyces sp. NPDC051320]|uniref:hypothetical protein n=1 Tax=Streptomyces sp. NPDC051320 TaxID=3154644 RepID=UPI0034424DC1